MDPVTHTAECSWCGKERTIVYVDVLDVPWCQACYEGTFLENFTPDPARVIPPVEADKS